ncbi:hypothetical protein FHETE_266 [Fusarium heterosporum]|uniref:Non-homologous end-joining factor 1 n=1 Tax=Fusarium heterosporum TaxID=42747 RepID=A0A8H5U4J1_FUSHE|nr:hypothetical protein FHETE_266 [Fusarium heterosporum]
MSQTKSWRSLPLPTSPDSPVLLVSFHADTAAYTIHITDMANVWAETLDRKAIFMRGWNENTSIDPSDTPDNMAKFLTSLGTALDASQSGHSQTNIRLDRDSRPEAGDHDLVLDITCEIPGLQPLKWPVYLKKLPAFSVATNLVLPLIQAHHAKDMEIESLVKTLEHKDAVLNKLLDKLEAMGTGMEHIFNALSGKKKVSRVTAAEKIPGLAPFDRRSWKSELQYQEDKPNDAESLVQSVFGEGGLQFEPTMNETESPQLDQWWQDFKGASSAARQTQHKAAATDDKPSFPKDIETRTVEEDDDNDDFQVQSTPPHLVSKGKSIDAKRVQVADDVSTEGESLVSTGSVSPISKIQKAEKSVRRLGALGRKKQSTPPRPPKYVQSEPRTEPPVQQRDESETASEAEDDETVNPLEVKDPIPSPSAPPRPTIKKGGLGRIGGAKSKGPVEENSIPLGDEVTESSMTAVSRHHPKKLGVIGKSHANKDKPTSAADEGSRQGRSTTTEPTASSKPRETSQERADRRREELKKELEKKAAAGPVKKKRKF